MKLFYTLTLALAVSLCLLACHNETEIDVTLPAVGDAGVLTKGYDSSLFPTDAAGTLLPVSSCASNVKKLLAVSDTTRFDSLYRITITPSEYQEIKTFTDQLVKGKTTQYAQMMAVLTWIRSNVKYAYDYIPDMSNDPYPVFKNKIAVCQGYAELMRVMMHTQGIKGFNVNGFLQQYGGHAWDYALADGKWYVLDPTNSDTEYVVDNLSSYSNWLIPYTIQAPLFEDEHFVYEFKDKHLNVRQVKAWNGNSLVIPNSASGYRLTSFNPSEPLPETITEIYLGDKITTIGEYVDGLNAYGGNLTNVYVKTTNTTFSSYDGCVYKKKDDQNLLYIPGQKTSVTFKKVTTVGKNMVFGNQALTEIWFPQGVQTIQDYAIEDCPNLKLIYVPSGTKVEQEAFYKVHPDCQVIYYDATGIHEVRM